MGEKIIMAYEVGDLIGCGYSSSFFRLKRYPRLGVKVIICESPFRGAPSDRKCKKRLLKELLIAQMLRKLDVPVPKYVGIVKVQFPSDLNPLIKNCPQRIHSTYLSFLLQMAGQIKYGLVMEIIEDDLSLTGKDTQRILNFLKEERKKLEKLGMFLPSDTWLNNNVLWSKKKKKFYFVDVEFWEIPWRLAWKLKTHRIRKAVIPR